MPQMPDTLEMGGTSLQPAPGSIVMPDWRMGRSIPVPKAR
jgi:hypothetical protein